MTLPDLAGLARWDILPLLLGLFAGTVGFARSLEAIEEKPWADVQLKAALTETPDRYGLLALLSVLLLPGLAAGRVLEGALAFSLVTPGAATALFTVVFTVAALYLISVAAGRGSPHLHVVIAFWLATTLIYVVFLSSLTVPILLEAATPRQAIEQIVTVPLPLQPLGPGLVLAPLAWLFVRDGYEVGQPTYTRAVSQAIFIAGSVIVAPIVVYLLSAWWATVDWLPHLFRFEGVRHVITVVLVTHLAAGLLAIGGIVWDIIQARRANRELSRRGVL